MRMGSPVLASAQMSHVCASSVTRNPLAFTPPMSFWPEQHGKLVRLRALVRRRLARRRQPQLTRPLAVAPPAPLAQSVHGVRCRADGAGPPISRPARAGTP